MNNKRYLAAALAAVATAMSASTSAALAAPVPIGTWSGTTFQTLSGNQPYQTKLVISAYQGRLQSVTGWVRMECPPSEIWDARLGKYWRVGRGPRLSAKGNFSTTFRAVAGHAIVMSGSLLKRRGSGAIGATSTEPHCVGRGTWLVKRRF